MTRDLLWAWRWLRKNPLFGTAVIAILGLGIGASTAIFSIVDAVLLRPLPYESSGRLVRIDETSTKRLISGVPALDYLRWRDRNDLFEQTVPYVKDIVTVTGSAGKAIRYSLYAPPVDCSALLGVRAQLGRALLDSDDLPGSLRWPCSATGSGGAAFMRTSARSAARCEFPVRSSLSSA